MHSPNDCPTSPTADTATRELIARLHGCDVTFSTARDRSDGGVIGEARVRARRTLDGRQGRIAEVVHVRIDFPNGEPRTRWMLLVLVPAELRRVAVISLHDRAWPRFVDLISAAGSEVAS